jgi:hypothetical protein
MIGLPLTRLACQGRKKKKYKQILLNYAITTLMWGAAREQIDEIADMYLSYLTTEDRGRIEEHENKTST